MPHIEHEKMCGKFHRREADFFLTYENSLQHDKLDMGISEMYDDIEAPESFKNLIKDEHFIKREWGNTVKVELKLDNEGFLSREVHEDESQSRSNIRS